jgi:hypothetical protein
MNNNPELTFDKIMNQEWKVKHIIGYGAGLYVGEGVEAFYLAKGSDKDIAIVELLSIYNDIATKHNRPLQHGMTYKKKKKTLWARFQEWRNRRASRNWEYPELGE